MKDNRPRLLVVEDDVGLQRQLRWAYDGYQLFIAPNRAEALAIMRESAPPVVTLDLGLPPDPDGISEGMATLREILAHAPATKVIVASGHGERSSAREAIAQGAWDFYQKPIDFDSLGHIVGRAFHVHALEMENARLAEAGTAPAKPGTGLAAIVTADAEMLRLIRMAGRVAQSGATVMLRGDSGTGKELFARGVHEGGPCPDGPFVAINCAAIPDALLESELFGHEKGAFTGAVRSTPGKVELANGGTLFLDEIGDMPPALQAKLLRFLETRCVERIGGRRPIAVDIRVVCATHRDLEGMIGTGQFREDLYYRLAEIVLDIPSLAARVGDAVLLARHFLRVYADALGSSVRDLTDDAIAAIDAAPWPGNVRELQNRVKRAVILAEGRSLTAADLDLTTMADAADGAVVDLKGAREQADRAAIHRAMTRSEGNVSAAARLLGVSRPTLYDLIKTYGL